VSVGRKGNWPLVKVKSVDLSLVLITLGVKRREGERERESEWGKESGNK